MAIAVNIFVKDTQVSPAVIQGVVVNVYNASTLAFVATATTDVNGRAAFLLPGGVAPGTSYEVRFYKLGVTFQNPATIQVLEPVSAPNTNDFDFTGTPFTATAPSDSRVCRCTGVFVDFANRPVANALLRIMAQGESGFQNPKVVDGNLVTPSVAEAHTDANGRVSVDLFRGGVYYVTFSGEDETVWSFVVPDRSNVNLIDLIHPQPVLLTWDSTVVPGNVASVAVGQTLKVPFTVTFSDYEVVTDNLGKWITITSSDGALAAVSYTSTSTGAALLVSGLSPGTITVTVTANKVLPSRVPNYSITAPVLTLTITS